MHDADLGPIQSTRRHIRRQPLHQVIHFCNGLGFRSKVLLTPTTNLTFKVITGFAVISQSAFFIGNSVKGRDDAVHFVIDTSTLRIAQVGQSLVPQNASLDKLHDIERATNHRLVFTQHMHFGDWYRSILQALHDFEFTLDRMR